MVAEDRQLVERMALRDESALAELYDRHGAAAYSFACSIIDQPADAEEVVLEVFMYAWSTADRYDSERGSVDSWLLAMIRSRCLDRVRSGRRRAARIERAAERNAADFAVPVGSTGDAPDDAAAQEELRTTLRRSLDVLPREQRTAIALAFFTGLSHREIARELDEPLGTVKSRIRAGMQRLRDDLRSVLGAWR